ncbi:MAG: tRNA (guanosine(37)-N1)-methyltransferase TrmD [Pseudobdellovibrio sp.]
MKFTYLSLFPQLIENYLQDALLKKATDKNILKFSFYNLRDYSDNKYKSIDDKPYGGGDGMIFRADIIDRVFMDLYNSPNYEADSVCRVYLSPQGKTLDQKVISNLLTKKQIVFLCGRYGGVDQRVINKHIDREISIGDFVLSGGELAALTITEAISRFIPGVVGDMDSVAQDSFSLKQNIFTDLLETPQYTKPSVWQDQIVPEVLSSGHHEKIKNWKSHMSLVVTGCKRLDIMRNNLQSVEVQDLDFLQEHFKFISRLDESDLLVSGLKRNDFLTYLDMLKNYLQTQKG